MSSAWAASGGLRPPTNPLTNGFTPGPHWVLRPQTHTIATAKQSCVCTEIYSYENAQKPLPPELLLLAQRPRPHWGSLQPSPDILAGIGDGASQRKGRREGRGKGRLGGKESRNAQIHSWQAYLEQVPLLPPLPSLSPPFPSPSFPFP